MGNSISYHPTEKQHLFPVCGGNCKTPEYISRQVRKVYYNWLRILNYSDLAFVFSFHQLGESPYIRKGLYNQEKHLFFVIFVFFVAKSIREE